MLSQENFLQRYRQLDTEALLQHMMLRDLCDEAREAARLVLIERGVSGERFELEAHRARVGLLRQAGVTNQCDHCGASIALGAFEADGHRFCSLKCRDDARLYEVAVGLAPDLVFEHARAIFTGACPRCGARGKPVEMRPRWVVISFVVACIGKVEHALCCRRCAQRKNWFAVAVCATFGWWSLDGIAATPVAIYRNVREIYARRVLAGPSPKLVEWAMLDLARRIGDPLKIGREADAG